MERAVSLRTSTLGQRIRRQFQRLGYNFWPCILGTGVRIDHIAEDWSELRVSLPLTWRTRNAFGTTFGGSIYAAVDPFYVIMLLHRLGKDFLIWDKSATVRFRRPGRSTLHARFVVDDAELDAIALALQGQRAIDRVYRIDLTDANGVVHATVEKVVYIRRKREQSREVAA